MPKCCLFSNKRMINRTNLFTLHTLNVCLLVQGRFFLNTGPLIKKRKAWTIQFLLNLKQIHTLDSGIFHVLREHL